MPLPCTGHQVYVMDRGGRQRLWELTPLASVQWGRLRDDISTATVKVLAAECATLVAGIEPGRHEICIYLEGRRVWEGPVTLLSYHRDEIEVQAKDVMYYAYRTTMHAGYTSKGLGADGKGEKVIDRAERILTAELARKEALDPPVNVLPFVDKVPGPSDSTTSRVTVPYEKSVFDEVDSLAEDAGMDYTVVGRSVLLFDTHTALGRTQAITDTDLVGDVRVTLYGSQLATDTAVSGADGDYGTASLEDMPDVYPNAAELRAYYGEWEILEDAFNEDDEDASAPSQESLDKQARSNLVDRNPVPLELRTPENAELAPTSPLTVAVLVPGVQIPLRAVFAGRRFNRLQKLNQMQVNEEGGGGVKVQISIVPANNSLPDEA